MPTIAIHLHQVQMETYCYRNNEQYRCKINHTVASLLIAGETEYLFCAPKYPSSYVNQYIAVSGRKCLYRQSEEVLTDLQSIVRGCVAFRKHHPM